MSHIANFAPVRVSVAVQVASTLREAIMSGELKPGERIVERKLAETMGISQGAVREALHILESEALVTKEANTATHVTTFASDEIAEMVDIRIDLEAKAFVLARRNLTRQSITELEALADQIDQGIQSNDYRGAYRSDFLFHQTVWRLAANATLEKMLTQLCRPLFAYLMVYLSASHRDLREKVKSHHIMVAALQDADERKAVEAVRQHVANSWLENLKESASEQTPALNGLVRAAKQ